MDFLDIDLDKVRYVVPEWKNEIISIRRDLLIDLVAGDRNDLYRNYKKLVKSSNGMKQNYVYDFYLTRDGGDIYFVRVVYSEEDNIFLEVKKNHIEIIKNK